MLFSKPFHIPGFPLICENVKELKLDHTGLGQEGNRDNTAQRPIVCEQWGPWVLCLFGVELSPPKEAVLEGRIHPGS